MSYIFKEENNIYQFHFSKAIWATDKLNEIYHNAKIELADVDFIIELEDKIIFLEYKNANIKNAIAPDKFNPLDNKKVTAISKKYYDSLTYINAIGKQKKIVCVYILEYPKGDVITRKSVRNRIVTKLPFFLQKQNNFERKLIESCKSAEMRAFLQLLFIA